jgi:protein ImuB
VKRILCVLLSNWPIDRAIRKRQSESVRERDFGLRIADCGLNQIHNPKSAIQNPLVLVRTIANRQDVVAVSDEAHRHGIRVGMTLAQARALHAQVEPLEHEPNRDAVALEALARWMMRFSPVVALPPLPPGEGRGEGPRRSVRTNSQKPQSTLSSASALTLTLSRRERGQDGLFLDLTGCEQVFHGLENLLDQISKALHHFRLRAHLAVAPTPGAAWAIAFARARQAGPSGPGLCPTIEPSSIACALENLPPIALRISPEIAQSLHHLGIETIGQLMKLPRDTLPARFGDDLLLRLDQALGHVPEPLVPLEHLSPIEARMDFDGAVDSLEAIWIVFKRLITQIVPELLRRGHGARELTVEFFRPYAVTLQKTIQLSRPSRDPSNLFNLLRCAMETLQTDVGFLGIKLTVSRSQRIADEQIQLLEHEEFIAESELDHLIERLRIRLGEKVIAQPQLLESYVPERAYSCHGLLARAKSRARVSADNSPWRAESACHVPTIRPLHLLTNPEQIGVIVTPSHDRDGRPVSFTWRGQVRRIVHSAGPERIAGQWWRGHYKTRDYFDIESPDGRRLWIFRVMETGRWFVHGEFE